MDSMEEMEEIGPKEFRSLRDQLPWCANGGKPVRARVGGAVAELVNGGLDSRTWVASETSGESLDHTGDGLVADSGELGHFEHGRTFALAWLVTILPNLPLAAGIHAASLVP